MNEILKDIKKLCEFWIKEYELEEPYPDNSTTAKCNLADDILDIIKDGEND